VAYWLGLWDYELLVVLVIHYCIFVKVVVQILSEANI
jgi:hypothetical protein